ncbi:MAG: hypothetical protein R1F52_03525 [Candidatus Nitrosoabyssus spongiisocia]|nr:MAG: hypothetical protein R1F52_03525 [Nitrosopumilaceae archaeon AB1(1)]
MSLKTLCGLIYSAIQSHYNARKCDRRGYHEPVEFDRLEFEDDPRYIKPTSCVDCGMKLVLINDPDVDDEYYVNEDYD